MLLAGIYDFVSLLYWSKTEDGTKNRNRPPSIVKKMFNTDCEHSDSDYILTFNSGEDYKTYRARIIGEVR